MNKEEIGGLAFETALEKLEEIIRDLESGKTSLENSINAYEYGIALKKHCEEKLREAQLKIEKINVGPDGSITKEELESQL